MLRKTPTMVLPTLPFLFKSTEQRRRVLDGDIGDELLASLESVGLVGLCFYDSGVRSIYSVDRPVRKPADMAGLKIRVQTSPAMAEIMQALGAQPMATPFAQVRAQLSAHTIDAAENNLISYRSGRHYEVAKVYSLTEHAAPPGIVLFSKRVWDQLSAEDRKIVRQAARDSVPYHRKLFDEQEAASRDVMAAAGVRFVTDIDKPAFTRILMPLYPRLVSDPRYKPLIDRIQAAD